jgi:hypothetical protein
MLQFVINTVVDNGIHVPSTAPAGIPPVGETLTFKFKNQLTQTETAGQGFVTFSSTRGIIFNCNAGNINEGEYLVTSVKTEQTFLAFVRSTPIFSESTYTPYSYDTPIKVYVPSI